MTLDCAKTGSTTRRKAEAAARRVCEANGFPAWNVMTVEKTTEMPNLCLVAGKVVG